MAHEDPVHFGRLIRALGIECDIYVHIDKKSEIAPFQKTVARNNVVFLPSRVSISWAGISMVDAQNLLIVEALKKKDLYSHFILLSGSDYPIKKTKQIETLLMESHDREFIKYIDMRESPDIYMKHINRKWFMEPFCKTGNILVWKIEKALREKLNLVVFKNHWSKDIIPYFGSQWFALTSECCEFLIEYQNDNPWYREMNRFTWAPDEHYFHTIVGNSHFDKKADGKQDYLGRGTWRMANLHIIDQSLTKWFTIDDWPEIKSSDKYFVRKVRSGDGDELVERIDRELLS